MSVSKEQLSQALDRERLIARLAALVRAESENPPGNEAEAGNVARAFCEELGLQIEVHEAEEGRPNVIARWSGTPGPTVAFCSHIDVVPAGDRALWEVDPYAA